MFGTYLLRELTHRRKQTLIVAIGMALAIALVIVVTAISTGVKNAQSSVLESVYGVGTDITVTQSPAPLEEGEQPGPRFEFGADAGTTADGTTTLSQSQLTTGFGTATFDADTLDTVTAVDGVAAATGTLSLTSLTFSGELPEMQLSPDAESGQQAPPQGGADGAGGSAFGVDSFTVEGIDLTGAAVGPLTAVTLTEGRTFDSGDAGGTVVILDSVYATTAELGVGDTIDIAGESFEVIGIVSSTSSDAATAANSYIPLDTAQTLADLEGQLSSIYVQASSSDAIPQVKADLEEALPETTVSTQADLAASVSGSLATASDLISGLGLWLSILVLAAAVLLAVLFTISGVTRRTREFGTLKAIGWSNGRVVRQVAGESVVQALLGGALGVVIGLVGILIVNLVAPTVSGSASTATGPGGGFAPPSGGTGDVITGGMGTPPGFAEAASTSGGTEIALQAPVTLSMILLAVGLSVLGGLVAGALGGWRAARLRPAEALRSVA